MMDADAFRHFYAYHFDENRKLWKTYIPALSHKQFVQNVGYSHGSVRNHLVHMMSVDDTWFSALRGVEVPEPLDPAAFDNLDDICACWERVERDMNAYLAALSDEMLPEKPFPAGEDQDLTIWQVLLHVVNHGTDHRAQLLRYLNELGVKTVSQDYIFYVYDHPQGA